MSGLLLTSAVVSFGLWYFSEDQKYIGIAGLLFILGLLCGSPWMLLKTLLFVAAVMTPIGLVTGWRD